MNIKRVSFDFDGTLDQKEVQDYCEELLSRGYEVFITTYRYCDMLAHLWQSNPSNGDLYKVVDKLGIPRTNIVFTNFTNKGNYLKDSRVLFHLDDCEIQLNDISEYSNNDYGCIGIFYSKNTNWRENCEKTLIY